MKGFTKDVRKLGYADLVVMRVAHNLPVDINAIFANECAENGYLELLERFDPPIDGLFWAKCMENKNYMLLDWAGDVAVPNNDTMTYLASRGNVNLMQNCVNSYYVRWDIDKVYTDAARNDRLNVLEWIDARLN